jgi:hypothetical protein
MRRIKLTRSESNSNLVSGDVNHKFDEPKRYNAKNLKDTNKKLIEKVKGRPKKNQEDKKNQKAYTYLTEKDKHDYYKYCNEHLRVDVAADLRKYILETLNRARSEGVI